MNLFPVRNGEWVSFTSWLKESTRRRGGQSHYWQGKEFIFTASCTALVSPCGIRFLNLSACVFTEHAHFYRNWKEMTVNSLLYCLRVILVLISLRFSFQFKFRACDRKLNCFTPLKFQIMLRRNQRASLKTSPVWKKGIWKPIKLNWQKTFVTTETDGSSRWRKEETTNQWLEPLANCLDYFNIMNWSITSILWTVSINFNSMTLMNSLSNLSQLGHLRIFDKSHLLSYLFWIIIKVKVKILRIILIVILQL